MEEFLFSSWGIRNVDFHRRRLCLLMSLRRMVVYRDSLLGVTVILEALVCCQKSLVVSSVGIGGNVCGRHCIIWMPGSWNVCGVVRLMLEVRLPCVGTIVIDSFNIITADIQNLINSFEHFFFIR